MNPEPVQVFEAEGRAFYRQDDRFGGKNSPAPWLALLLAWASVFLGFGIISLAKVIARTFPS